MSTLEKTHPDRRAEAQAQAQAQAQARPARAIPRYDISPGSALPDVRLESVGSYVGRIAPDDPVGGFGNVPRLRRRGAGGFAGDPDRQRQGSFGDHDLGHSA